MAKKRKCRRYSGIGGQAVLEGVMMKNNEEYAVSVRKPDGTIETKKEKHKGILGNKVVTKIPFIRGVFNFVDSLVLGMQTLTWSASFYDDEDSDGTKTDQMLDKVSGGNGEKILMGGTVVFSILLAVAVSTSFPIPLGVLAFTSFKLMNIDIIAANINNLIFLIFI